MNKSTLIATSLPLILGTVWILLFRKNIGRLIDRANSLKWWNVKVEAAKNGMRREGRARREPVTGVTFVEAGGGRDEMFMAARQRAKKRVVIMGIGMSELSHSALDTLKSRATDVNIDLLMVDPEFLRRDSGASNQLNLIFGKENFASLVETNFEILRALCIDWNSDRDHLYKFRLRLYGSFPTMTMVSIDPDEKEGEILFECFLPGTRQRTRFKIEKRREPQMFSWFWNDLSELWRNAKDGLI